MNFDSAQKIAAAILYEGYILYPYRKTSIKNRQRWNFGTLYPRAYAEAQRPAEPYRLQAEFLLEAPDDAAATLDVRISFLQLLSSSQSQTKPSAESFAKGLPEAGHGFNRAIKTANFEGALAPEVTLTDPSLAWEEAVERTAEFADLQLEMLKSDGLRRTVTMNTANLPEGAPAGTSPELIGILNIRAEKLDNGAWKLHLEFQNDSQLPSGAQAKRTEALPRSFVSAHVLLGARNAEFISLLEPPEKFREAAAKCNQVGIFPVLAGDEPARNILFCSPIILYDYPKIAPESEGDFFDGTEMDEMLALRVMTLTDAEKQEMREGDPRARRILERTEAMTPEMMMNAHGVIRSLRAVGAEKVFSADAGFGNWDPFAEEKAAPQSVRVFGVELRVGDRVRLWPQKKADIMDLALYGKVAMIEAIEQDLEDQIQFAVVLDDDPGREFGMMRQPGHRFFFTPDEVEPVSPEGPA